MQNNALKYLKDAFDIVEHSYNKDNTSSKKALVTELLLRRSALCLSWNQ
jgi:hypothetical protein